MKRAKRALCIQKNLISHCNIKFNLFYFSLNMSIPNINSQNFLFQILVHHTLSPMFIYFGKHKSVASFLRVVARDELEIRFLIRLLSHNSRHVQPWCKVLFQNILEQIT